MPGRVAGAVLDELRESGSRLSPGTRESLAAEAFAYTARYDSAIARWFQEKSTDFPPPGTCPAPRCPTLRRTRATSHPCERGAGLLED